MQAGRRARLVVVAGEVGRRWSVRHLAEARARGEPTILRRRAEQAWRSRWCSLLACGVHGHMQLLSWNGAELEVLTVARLVSVHYVLTECRFVGLELAA